METGTLSGVQQAPDGRATADAIYRKVTFRVVPLIFVAYLFAFLDRINVGYAQLQMKQDLGFSDAVYGIGAGIFFVSYLLFEVPSNLLFERMGARKTFLRIMVLWGLASTATMFVKTPAQFYTVRFVLGIFEAGFFPGVILYLTYWFPAERRGRVTGQFLFALPVAGVIGGPLSGAIMARMDGIAGWSGWQWCFLLEGLPTVLIGILCYLFLSDKPEHAPWLNRSEKEAISAALAKQDTGAGHGSWAALLNTFRDSQVYVLAFIYFSIACGTYTFSFWLPTMIKGLGVTDVMQIGWYSLIPYAFGAAGMLLLSRSSDLRRERRLHVAIPCLVAAAALSATTFTNSSLTASLILFSVSNFFLMGAGPVFWSIPPTCLNRETVAAGIATVSSLGIVGGFVSPTLIGIAKASTGHLSSGLYLMSVLLVFGAAIAATALSSRVTQTRSSGRLTV